MKKVKIVIRIFIILVVLCLLALGGISAYFYHIAIARSSKDFLKGNEDLEATTVVTDNDTNTAWLESADFEELNLVADDGLKLHANYLRAEKDTKKIVILAHGYSSRGVAMISYARFYSEILGYNVLLPDNRGHGESEGKYIGFGWPDRKDYVKWINMMITKVGEDCEIVLHGVSMGGATVLMTSGETLPANVKAIVADCSYTSVQAQLEYQLERMYNLPSFPILPATSLMTKIRAGYFFSEASALEQVKKSATPILFIHGDEDKFVPYEMVLELYDACSSEKELFIVKGAEHGTAYREAGEKYEKTVIDFLDRYVTK